jgi:DNA-binding NarL/FixJ family response regulator
MSDMPSANPKTTILLIDDNENDRTYYATQLQHCSPDCVVLEAKNGQAGLDLCKSQKIDCIVAEYNLPDMNPLQLLFEVNPIEDVPAIALVILARYAVPAIANLVMRYGVNAFLIKRLTSGEDLTNVIQRAMAKVKPSKHHLLEA